MATSEGVSTSAIDAAEIRVKFCLDGQHATEQAASELAHTDLASLTPITKAPAYSGRRGYSGYWWLASVRRSVPFSTLSEVDMLISLDYSNKYTQFIHNPFRISWPTSSRSKRRQR
ncbi:hypothetical protein EDD41_0480 [Luteococcus japonicus]|uniref:Uncharacterized protein n=1 Tax=Luteococcus japonicus TaxID=33984 RepID=A0A3N1ZR13_9ACTN|nr:hypothetical protein [Luteococcus japonicus]ROR53339.1 hypothetical protein EDD41_0480 [Luteococcus japonicus]